jgi:hypothetical protein
MAAAELLRDGKLAKSSDVYSFGMVMWEMYCGRRLFENNVAGQARAQKDAAPCPPPPVAHPPHLQLCSFLLLPEAVRSGCSPCLQQSGACCMHSPAVMKTSVSCAAWAGTCVLWTRSMQRAWAGC